MVWYLHLALCSSSSSHARSWEPGESVFFMLRLNLRYHNKPQDVTDDLHSSIHVQETLERRLEQRFRIWIGGKLNLNRPVAHACAVYSTSTDRAYYFLRALSLSQQSLTLRAASVYPCSFLAKCQYSVRDKFSQLSRQKHSNEEIFVTRPRVRMAICFSLPWRVLSMAQILPPWASHIPPRSHIS